MILGCIVTTRSEQFVINEVGRDHHLVACMMTSHQLTLTEFVQYRSIIMKNSHREELNGSGI